jgi:hemerythrin superfamily protein
LTGKRFGNSSMSISTDGASPAFRAGMSLAVNRDCQPGMFTTHPANRSPPMTTARKTATTRKASTDAIKLLTEDHKAVKALFKQYEKLVKDEAEDEEKQQIAQQICTQLSVHAAVEEEIFYPAAREVLDEADLVDEADVEHASVKELVGQIESSSPEEDDHYDARVKVLGEYVDHHVKEEEGELFPKLKKSDLDLDAVGEQIAARKEELLAELGETAEA